MELRRNNMTYKKLAQYYAKSVVDENFSAFHSGDVVSVGTPFTIQSDGKILFSDRDFLLNEVYTGPGLFRLNTDGSVDRTFSCTTDQTIFKIIELSDGKILIGGFFSEVNGESKTYLARLNSDGSLDESFNDFTSNPISKMFIQSDGKILIGDYLSEVNGVAINSLARLNSDGSLDESFNLSASVGYSQISLIGIQSNNKSIVFAYNDTEIRYEIIRLNSDGTLDPTFSVIVPNNIDYCTIQPDGKILFYGFGPGFEFNGIAKDYIVRFNSDGTIDESFYVNLNGIINNIYLQPDGKIFIAGDFNSIENQYFPYLARLRSDGSLDTTFNVSIFNGENFVVMNSVLPQLDGKILVTGGFSTVNSLDKTNIVMLQEIDALPYNLVYTAPLDKSVIVKDIFLTSISNFAYKIAILPENDSIEDISEKNIYENSFSGAGTFKTTGRNIVLSPGDKIYMDFPGNRKVSVNIFGVEI
jgi:uncharacterized delta-60 repeat protein